MEEDIFTLRPMDEFVELVKLLKLRQIAQSGGHAKIMITEGEVRLNGAVEYQKRKKLRPGDIISGEGFTIKIAAG